MSIGRKATHQAAKVMAATGWELLSNPELLEAVKAEFTRQLNGRTYQSLNDSPSNPGDFQGRCHSLAAIQAASIKCSARIGSVSSGGLLIHTSSGWRQQRVDRLQRLGWAWRAFS